MPIPYYIFTEIIPIVIQKPESRGPAGDADILPEDYH
jgi:hypothetical protein